MTNQDVDGKINLLTFLERRIKMYEKSYQVDLHTHTIASGHAYNTIQEMAKAAKEKGISLLGITEHSMTMPGTCSEIYFQNLWNANRSYYGVQLLLGVELNIIDYQGSVDMSQELLANLDIAIASIHNTVGYNVGTKAQNTSAVIGAIKNPYVNIIGHPDDGRIPLDYKEVVKAAKEYHKILEINNNSLSPTSWRENARENDRKILELCAKEDYPVIIGSDAHADHNVGANSYALDLMKEIQFPEHLILNYYMDELKSYIYSDARKREK